MVKFYPNGIIVTKGDTIRMPIIVTNNDGTIYNVQDMDVITFHLKENYEDEECLIETQIDNDDLMLVVSHEDTSKLEIGKTYVFELKVKKENDDVSTFMQGKLKAKEAVCFK